MSCYHVSWKGQTSGPFTEDELIAMINSGSVGSLHTILEDGVATTLESFIEARSARAEEVQPEPPESLQPEPVREHPSPPPPPPTPPPPQSYEPRSHSFPTTADPTPSHGIIIFRGMRRLGEFSVSELASAFQNGSLFPDDSVLEGNRHIPLGEMFPQLRESKHPDLSNGSKTPSAAASEDFIYDLRMATAYRSFRWIVRIVSILVFLIATLGAIGGGLLGGIAIAQGEYGVGVGIICGSLVYGGIIVACGLFWRDFCTIIADIGDCNLRREFRRL